MKKKEREERLKKEGKFLTEKQKQDKRRLEQMLAAMKEAGKLSFPPSPPPLSAYYSKKFFFISKANKYNLAPYTSRHGCGNSLVILSYREV